MKKEIYHQYRNNVDKEKLIEKRKQTEQNNIKEEIEILKSKVDLLLKENKYKSEEIKKLRYEISLLRNNNKKLTKRISELENKTRMLR